MSSENSTICEKQSTNILIVLMLISVNLSAQTMEERSARIEELRGREKALVSKLKIVRGEIKSQEQQIQVLKNYQDEYILTVKAKREIVTRTKPSNTSGEVFYIIPKDAVFSLINYEKEFYLANYEEQIAYVFYPYVWKLEGVENFTQMWKAKNKVRAENALIERNKIAEHKRLEEEEVRKKNLAHNNERDEENVEAQIIKNQKRIDDLIIKYGQIDGQKIINGRVWIGMNSVQAKESWGSPKDINRTTFSNLVKEQWVYSYAGMRKYLYFENDILTAIQD